MSVVGTWKLLEWDTAFFGFPIARLSESRLTETALRAAGEWCRQNSVQCVYVLVPAEDDESVLLAERYGLHLVDIRVSLARKISHPVSFGQPEPGVRLWRAKDLPVLMDIASTVITSTRFHVDRHFLKERASALYREWVRKSCETPDGAVLVADRSNGPIGFITCDPVVSGRAVIGLCGVREEVRGAGIGTKLVRAALQWFGANGAEWVEVVTQGRNITALQLYQRSGFITRSVQLWYHWWV